MRRMSDEDAARVGRPPELAFALGGDLLLSLGRGIIGHTLSLCSHPRRRGPFFALTPHCCPSGCAALLKTASILTPG